MQVLSPMWHFMEEAASWYSPEGVPAPAKLDVSIFQHPRWDWASVVVMTCPRSCHVGCDTWCVVKEEVDAVNLLEGARVANIHESLAVHAAYNDDGVAVDTDAAACDLVRPYADSTDSGG
jgi:hypothetical protein